MEVFPNLPADLQELCTPVECKLCTVKLTRYRLGLSMLSRLLHPQHLDGILTGLTPYRLPLDTLSEYPEP